MNYLLNVHTKVTLECNGPSVKLTVGGHVYTAVQPNHRFAGKLLVYAGNTYEQNANAEINGFEYEILPATKAKAGTCTDVQTVLHIYCTVLHQAWKVTNILHAFMHANDCVLISMSTSVVPSCIHYASHVSFFSFCSRCRFTE